MVTTYPEYKTVFIDAPHVLEPADLTGHGMSLDTLGAPEASASSEDPALKPRAWYKADPTRTRADGLEESLAFLRDTLKTQRFEVRHQRLQRRGLSARRPLTSRFLVIRRVFLVSGWWASRQPTEVS